MQASVTAAGLDNRTKNRKGTILRLSTYLLHYKWLLLLAIVCTFGSNLFSLIGPKLTGYAIGAIEPGKGAVDFETVGYYAAWMAVFYVLSALMSYGLQVLMITISRKVVYKMRQDVFEKLMSLPVGYFDVHQTGDIISRISYDIDTVNASLSNDLVQLLTTVITVVGALGMMISISPKLVLVFAVTVPMSIGLTKAITARTRPLFRLRSAKLGAMNGFVEEMVTGQKTLKAYGREEDTISRFDEKNKEVKEFLEEQLSKYIEDIDTHFERFNSKAVLQEYTQSQTKELPEYETISVTGPAHKPIFEVRVKYCGKILATAEGKSKKEAEQNCAYQACRTLGIIED